MVRLQMFIFGRLSRLLIVFQVKMSTISRRGRFLRAKGRPTRRLRIFFRVSKNIRMNRVRLFYRFTRIYLFFKNSYVSLPMRFLVMRVKINSTCGNECFAPWELGLFSRGRTRTPSRCRRTKENKAVFQKGGF